MATKVSFGPVTLREGAAADSWWQRLWLVALAALSFAGPGLYALATREWSTEQGAAGPIILASGLWLLVREGRDLRTPRDDMPTVGPWLTLLVLLLAGYLLGIAIGMLWLNWLCTYAALVVVLGSYVGAAGLARLWFPLGYLLFLVPPPYTLIAAITNSRKMWLSETSVHMLSTIGFDVANNGTMLYIDGYELRIADACAGMNSLVSLLAISLFYVYLLHRADWRYAVLLALSTLPVAMIANLVRILLVLVVAHYGGATLALGTIHEAAGILMFLVALGCLIGLDGLLTPLRAWLAS